MFIKRKKKTKLSVTAHWMAGPKQNIPRLKKSGCENIQVVVGLQFGFRRSYARPRNGYF